MTSFTGPQLHALLKRSGQEQPVCYGETEDSSQYISAILKNLKDS